MTTTTTIYTYGVCADDVIAGFLGGMSAAQVCREDDGVTLAEDMARDCDIQMYPHGGYALTAETLSEAEFYGRDDVIAFTCRDIAARIVEMAREELADAA